MERFALWVELDIKPGLLPAFLAAARRNAEGSVRDEPGCHRFDILRDPALADRVCLYEVYTDESAFDAHQRTPHFRTYFATTPPMIATRKSTRLIVAQHDKSQLGQGERGQT